MTDTIQTVFAVTALLGLVSLLLPLAERLSIPYAVLLALVGIAIGGTTAHYCLTNALRVADAIVVIPLDFLRIPLIAFVGYTFYGERLDVLVFAGAGIIVAGIVWNLRAEMR